MSKVREVEKIEGEITAPVPPQLSVGAFLKTYGADRLLDGLPSGQRGIDWDEILSEDVDGPIKRDGLLTGRKFRLLRFINPDSETDMRTEHPYLRRDDGTMFLFTVAKYQNRTFIVTAWTIIPGQEPKRRDYNVPELTALIGSGT